MTFEDLFEKDASQMGRMFNGRIADRIAPDLVMSRFEWSFNMPNK